MVDSAGLEKLVCRKAVSVKGWQSGVDFAAGQGGTFAQFAVILLVISGFGQKKPDLGDWLHRFSFGRDH